MSNRTTRLAPSPTGALHLGNARTFLITWAMARTLGWRLEMRIEDLDGPRVKPAAAQQALDAFSWLGIDYDGSKTSSDASVNYTVQEYANDVVFGLHEVCEEEQVPPPTIVCESGRMLVAYHSVLVPDVRGSISGPTSLRITPAIESGFTAASIMASSPPSEVPTTTTRCNPAAVSRSSMSRT